MDEKSLASLPLPILTAALCSVIAVLIWRADFGAGKARLMFSALFALSALNALLVGLRFGYGVELFIPLQRVLPLAVGPLLYLGFIALAAPGDLFGRLAAWHLGVAVAAALGFSLVSGHFQNLDWGVGASYVFYVIALVLLWRRGPDHLIHVRLGAAPGMSNWLLRGAGFLTFLLVLDSVIAFDFAWQRGSNVSAIISYGSVLLILVLLAFIFALPSMFATTSVRPKGTALVMAEAEKLEVEARVLLTDSQLYLDPDLSVQRLAKRLHVPERTLSAAINQSQGMNVSQYVNGFRLAHACDLLRSSQASVAQIMVQSGFLTRSNFYREFQRVYGQTPAAYRQSADCQDDAA